MRTELAPFPTQQTPAVNPSQELLELRQLVQAMSKKVIALEAVLGQMTVNNTTRQVLWNGVTNTSLPQAGGNLQTDLAYQNAITNSLNRG